MNTLLLFHFYYGIIIPFGFFILIHKVFLEKPSAKIPNIRQQYFRNFRNIAINMMVFSSIGVILNLFVNIYSMAIFETKSLSNFYYDLLWVIVSILVWMFWPKKLLSTPPENSVLRTTNVLGTQKRSLPEEQGEVDNTAKYTGSVWAVQSVFEKDRGIIETESRKPINVTMSQMTCRDDVGSCEFILSFAVEDPDAFAANGDTIELREQKVRDTVAARIMVIIERQTHKHNIRSIMANPEKFFKDISEMFRKENRTIEARLGIRIQYIEVTNINESKAHRQALESAGVNDALLKQAQKWVKASQDDGTDEDLSIKEAQKLVAGTAGKIDYTVLDTPTGKPFPRNITVMTKTGDKPKEKEKE